RVRLLDLKEFPPYSTHPRVTRPLIWEHPRTGKKLLAASQFHTSHIEGMSNAESEAIIQDIFVRLYASDNMYRHAWMQGDLVIWDNYAVQHGRSPFEGMAKAATRTLRRVCINSVSVVEIMAGVTYNSTGGFKVPEAGGAASE